MSPLGGAVAPASPSLAPPMIRTGAGVMKALPGASIISCSCGADVGGGG